MSRRTNYHYENVEDDDDDDINQLRSKVNLLKTVSIINCWKNYEILPICYSLKTKKSHSLTIEPIEFR